MLAYLCSFAGCVKGYSARGPGTLETAWAYFFIGGRVMLPIAWAAVTLTGY